MAKGPLIALAGLAAGAITVGKALSDIQDIAAQGQLAKSLGMTSEAFTGLAGVAGQFGVDTNGVFEGLVSLSQKAQEALKGGDLGATFRKLGIDVQAFAAMDPGKQFETLHAALQNVSDPAERVRILMATMGEEAGKKLAPLLNKSTEELKKLTGQFAVSSGDMKKIQGADAAMKKVTASISALWRKVVVAVAPVIEFISTRLTTALEKLEPVFQWVSRAITTHWGIILDILGEVFDAIGEVITLVVDWVSELFNLGSVTTTIEEVVTGVWKAIGIAGAYAWDTIKAGMGFVAIGAGLLVKGFSKLIDLFADLVGVLKELPENLRPDGLNEFIKGVEQVRDTVRDAGDGMMDWGKGAVDNFGKSADKVREWFEKRKNKAKTPEEVKKAGPQAKAEPPKPVYTAVAAAIKGSREEFSIATRFKMDNKLNPQLDLQRKQLMEQQKANELARQAIEAIRNIPMPMIGVF
jgi:hypothetical protein